MLLQPVDSDFSAAPRNLGAAEGALLRRIDLTTLRLFIAVCEEKNLTRAAMREGIAASAVSKRMNDFEAAFDVSLFERLAKGMALTPAGAANTRWKWNGEKAATSASRSSVRSSSR